VYRIIDRLGPFLALAPARRRYGPDTVLIVDGTLVPTRDHTVAASSKNYRYSTNMQVMIDAATRLVVAVGQPQPGNRNDCVAYSASKIDRAAGGATVMADGGYQGTGVRIPHRRRAGQTQLTGWKERDNTTHRRV
jgi:Transposase DDE domain